MRKLISTLLDQFVTTKDSDEKEKLINEFKDRIWNSKYKFQTFKKYITYSIDNNLMNNRQDLIDLFKQYQVIEIKYCKSIHRGSDMDGFDYIRIHINNMYGYLVNKDVYLSKEYYQLLLSPKNEYYRVIDMIKNGEEVDSKIIDKNIKESWENAKQVKEQLIKKKLNMDWNTYKTLIDGYINRIFNNYMLPEEYEKKHKWEMMSVKDGGLNNNYTVSYFCKSLTGYMRHYIHEQSRAKHKYCEVCGTEIDIHSNRKYCKPCSQKVSKKKHNDRQKKYINKK